MASCVVKKNPKLNNSFQVTFNDLTAGKLLALKLSLLDHGTDCSDELLEALNRAFDAVGIVVSCRDAPIA